MPKYRYIGDQASLTLWGIEFPAGKGVEVEGVPAAKLAGNTDFEEVKPGRPKKVKADGEDGE